MGLAIGTAASGSHVAKVRWNRVLCVGAGGLSGAATGSVANTGGAAGGASALSRRSLTPGTSYAWAVGQSVAGTVTTSAVAGGDTTFNATDVVAKGGAGSALVSAASTQGTGVAGSTTGCVGTQVFAGGNGANGAAAGASPGGGGGAGAGYTAVGGNASAGTGGTGNFPGGNGGTGGSSSAGGTGPGVGSGAGGAHANNTTDRAGGTNGAGQIRIDWNPPSGLCMGMGVC